MCSGWDDPSERPGRVTSNIILENSKLLQNCVSSWAGEKKFMIKKFEWENIYLFRNILFDVYTHTYIYIYMYNLNLKKGTKWFSKKKNK